MRKLPFLLSLLLLSFMLLIPHLTLAHTISQHLEELYGETYLPLFIIAKLLPFIGLGMLSYDQGSSKIPWKNQRMLLIGILPGIILSYFTEDLQFLLIMNKVEILLFGFLLLIINRPKKFSIQMIILIAGISLGYEYGINTAHAREFKWLFISLLLIGVSIFLVLNRFQFFRNGVMNLIRISSGILLVVAGLIVILLT